MTDDVPGLDLAEGDRLRYRAVLLEPGFPQVVSDTVTMRVAEPEPAFESVTVAGNLQWSSVAPTTGRPTATYGPDLPALRRHVAGDLHRPGRQQPVQWKIATGDDWNKPNYGPGGGGGNYSLSVPDDADYEFVFNQTTKSSTATLLTPEPGRLSGR